MQPTEGEPAQGAASPHPGSTGSAMGWGTPSLAKGSCSGSPLKLSRVGNKGDEALTGESWKGCELKLGKGELSFIYFFHQFEYLFNAF